MIKKINEEILWNAFENTSGERFNVYRISNNFVAKFTNRTKISLEEECEKQKIIHLEGISSPKPLGIFELPFPETFCAMKKGGIYSAFVMEYIEGDIINSLKEDKKH